MKKTEDREPSLFFLNFHGEFLNILLDTKLNSAHQTDEEVSTSELPMLVEGFLVDEDSRYYYLGKVSNTVNRAVPKRRVLDVVIAEPQDIFSTILDDMEKPDKNGVN